MCNAARQIITAARYLRVHIVHTLIRCKQSCSSEVTLSSKMKAQVWTVDTRVLERNQLVITAGI